MAVRFEQLNSREEWLAARTTIGGSEAAALVGKSPWMSNVDLWEIKTGRSKSADLSRNELVVYGQQAEPLLRELFALDNPEYEVYYQANNIWRNTRYKFAHASLDGYLIRKSDRAEGILEIKTATIQSATQAEKWHDTVPINYLIQTLWCLGVCEAKFAVICAQLKRHDRNGEEYKITRQYFIDRADHEQDIKFLLLKGETFWRYVTEDVRPAINLDI